MISFLLLCLLGSAIFGLSFFSLRKILFEGKLIYAVYSLALILATSATFQILVFDVTKIAPLASSFTYLKEVFILLALLSWAIYKRDIFSISFSCFRYDYVGIFFLALTALYFVLPLGEATFVNKAIYFKNILVLAAVYFLGRNMKISTEELLKLFHFVLLIIVCAFPIVIIEKLTDTHFQTMIGYTDFVIAKGGETTGSYGLQYTFQANSGAKRFASFFPSPLSLATAGILGVSISLALLNTYRNRAIIYLGTTAISFLCLFFSYSRAPLAGLFLMLIYVVYLLGYWRYIVAIVFAGALFITIPILFGSDDLRFFIIDTFSLADPSSVGHLVDWLDGIESMLINPEGIGMATSGNAGGVDSDLQVGGENQFIIIGVQFGVIGMLIYSWLIIQSIVIPKKLFRRLEDKEAQILPFILTSFKLAFLMSLLTANAEIYNFVAYLSWWMMGLVVQRFETLPETPKEPVLLP